AERRIFGGDHDLLLDARELSPNTLRRHGAAGTLEDHRRRRERERDVRSFVLFARIELELALLPAEDVEELRLHLELERELEIVRRDRSHLDQELALLLV